jgi:hypothetical protein
MRMPELEAIKKLLHYDWDPIGVAGIEEALDEYDSYAVQVYSKLQAGESVDEVAAYLAYVVIKLIGLKANPARERSVANAAAKLVRR